jgi:molybdenum cofactor cytidylyltransferase
MGQPKQLLPWGASTVIATVLQNLADAGATPVVCVVGHHAAAVSGAVGDTTAEIVHNPNFQRGETLSSYQAGIRFLQASLGQRGRSPALLGALLALGDQPHIPAAITRQVIEQAQRTPDALVIPSYSNRRGHPIYVPAALWPELVALSLEDTLRTTVQRHQDQIEYVNVGSDAILRDIDTPADYQALVDQSS